LKFKKFLIYFLTVYFMALTNLWGDEGKDLFIKNCANCHKSGGSAPVINPADKAGEIWKKYFSRGRHPDNEKMMSSIGEENSKKILNYLMNNAADSEHPEAAIIPK